MLSEKYVKTARAVYVDNDLSNVKALSILRNIVNIQVNFLVRR